VANALTQQIIDLIETKCAGITVVGGYNSTVLAANIHHPPTAPQDIPAADCPAIVIRHLGNDSRYHLRGAEELTLEVQFICMSTTDALLKNLMGDVKKLVYANPRWNSGSADLARRTWVAGERAHETEVAEGVVSGSVIVAIVARASRTDPTAVKAV
jgi:hypothetical protein